MSPAKEILDSVYSVGLFLILVPAIWVAGEIILSQVPVLRSSQDESTFPLNSGGLVLYWIVLAGLFILPLTDLLRLGFFLLETILPGLYVFGQPVMATMWGSASWPVFTGTQFLFTLSVYGFVLFHFRRLDDEISVPYLGKIRMTKIERIFIILGIEGLVNQLADAIVSRFVWLHVPVITHPISQGMVGITISWLVALILLAANYRVINGRVSSRENEEPYEND